MRSLFIFAIFMTLNISCIRNMQVERANEDELDRFFPMKEGYTWTYLLTSIGDNTTSLITTKIEGVNRGEIKINSNGSEFYYIRTGDGIMKKSSGYYILKSPIKAGLKWEFVSDKYKGSITITDVHLEIKVRDRIYKNCLVTEERILGQNYILKTYYAEGVGPVLIEQYLVDGGRKEPVLRAELLGYSFDESVRELTE